MAFKFLSYLLSCQCGVFFYMCVYANINMYVVLCLKFAKLLFSFHVCGFTFDLFMQIYFYILPVAEKGAREMRTGVSNCDIKFSWKISII